LTSPSVLSFYLLDGPVVHQAPEDSRDHFLVVSEAVLESGESDRFCAGADRLAYLGFSLGEL
jgi:hypothetical protein